MTPRSGLTAGSILAIVFASTLFADPRFTFDPGRYAPIDTSRLLGSPDPLPPLEIEKAFPHLGFVRPVAITHAGDGSDRIFVCDQPGRIYVFPNHSDAREAKVFLDIREKTRTKHFEEGLLGLAFHPRYKETGELYVYYSTDPQVSVIARFRVSGGDPNRAEESSEEEVLRVRQPYGNHNGGGIEFGPDGMLYIPLGDGGSANDPHGNGQNLTTLLGSVLRIDVDRRDPGKGYAIPPDNPFAGEAGRRLGDGVRGEIWAYGLRNPWRMTFDRLTGDCWLGDVGQNLWEEIDIIVRGGNYGWKRREGRHEFDARAAKTGDAFIEPLWEYPRQDGKSITGGLVYRGRRLPELFGTYLYADFVTFNVWGLRYDGKAVTSNHLIARSKLPISAFGEDEAGEVYFCAFEAGRNRDITRLNAGQVYNLNQGGIYRFKRSEARRVDTAAFPRRLSETGLFVDLPTLEPAPGLIPYSVNVPLWSDGAAKERYLALPAGGKVVFSESGQWQFPVGSVLVKTFSLGAGEALHRLETRLLVRSERGWDGYTYLWNEDRTEAQLLDSALTKSYSTGHGHKASKQAWYFPSRSDCNACHTEVAGHVLGLNTRQLNRVHDYGGRRANQIDVLSELDVFEERPPRAAFALEAFPDWSEKRGSKASLARAYLDVNCAICHAPGGTGIAKADMRYHTPLESAFLLHQEAGQKRFGAADSKIVLPGAPQRSELLLRMLGSGPGRMPALASERVDWEAVGVIGEWIQSLAEE